MATGILGESTHVGFTWIIVIAIAAAVVVILVWVLRQNDRFPVETVSAIVDRIEETVSGNAMSGRVSRNMPMAMPLERTHVTFRLENDDTLEFNVDNAQSGRWKPGMRGKLCYRGDRFISFGEKENE